MKKLFLLSLLVGFFLPCLAQYGAITTLAGGSGGCFDSICFCYDSYSGDGAPASAYGACFNGIQYVYADHSGNVLVADQGNYRLRLINAATDILSTLAGNGTGGYSGDGGPATNASIGSVTAIFADRSDNYYFVDWDNHRIRRVDNTTGIISTVAGNGGEYSGDGGPATAAGIGEVTGLFIDNSGNIYLADYNSRVRKVNAGTGIISTIAGNGTYGFSGDGGAATTALIGYPLGITGDVAGNIYISDWGNNRVRKINSSGVISTVAGGGTIQSDGCMATSASIDPGNIGIDSASNIYIYNNGNVSKVWASTGIINTIVGNGGFSFNSNSLYVDSAGNIYGGDGSSSGTTAATVNKVTGA